MLSKEELKNLIDSYSPEMPYGYYFFKVLCQQILALQEKIENLESQNNFINKPLKSDYNG